MLRRFTALLLLLVALPASAITAQAYMVMDLEGKVLLEHNADDVRPIASLTKLLVSKYAKDQDPDELLTVTAEDVKNGRMRTTPLRAGQSYTRRELMELALVSSDNIAAIVVGNHLPEGIDIPVSEWSGLSVNNQLSARQLAELARSLYSTDIASMSVQPSVIVGDKVRRSTNPLIESAGWNFYLSKTGFIRDSGGCLTVITEIANQTVIAVILGSKSTRARWRDLVQLRQQLGDTSSFTIPVFKQPRVKKLHKRNVKRYKRPPTK